MLQLGELAGWLTLYRFSVSRGVWFFDQSECPMNQNLYERESRVFAFSIQIEPVDAVFCISTRYRVGIRVQLVKIQKSELYFSLKYFSLGIS